MSSVWRSHQERKPSSRCSSPFSQWYFSPVHNNQCLRRASFSTLPSPPLKIIVGTEEKKQVLYIKKESICPKSKSIQELCSRKKDLTKDKTQLVLVDVIKQPEVFVVFLVWVVTGDINRAEGLTELVPFENESYPFKHAPGLFPSQPRYPYFSRLATPFWVFS